MNIIEKRPVETLGYNFIPRQYLPEGKDEYHLRYLQNRNGVEYRQLTAAEIEQLVRNRNSSDNWNMILVSDAFNAEFVKNCKFHGLVRIGKLEPYYLEFHNLRLPVGLYNSKIISCDLGDNVAIDNVDYLSHYIIGNDVIIVNCNEVATTNVSKFGNGVIKDGEAEKSRIKMEICNENAGREIIPFNGMLPGDAFLWSRYREDKVLMEKLTAFTEKKFDHQRGYYGKIGDRTVIKNCAILKDVWIGSDAYLKGANKLKNLTINSSAEAKSQIGEGCEMVNGIVGFGCKIFYGVKAIRFIMASQSQLKYGARLLNSYLGNNSTISCCEVLNSLIFPAHEQHHNNSFLCASMVMGQSNIAAGATIGSNHNSRSADGELIAGRGFWPGLCVSLKHNSRFASFNIVAKGDYPAELNIPIPFALVSNDASKDQLEIMPGYWFMYNMYALSRNSWKYVDRDHRIEKIQHIEYDFLAPDSINELITSIRLFQEFTGIAYYKAIGKLLPDSEAEIIQMGKELLDEKNTVVDDLEILANFENSGRKVVLLKVLPAYHIFRELIVYHAARQLIGHIEENSVATWQQLENLFIDLPLPGDWINAGGQLIEANAFRDLIRRIDDGRVNSWDEIHAFYTEQGAAYPFQKLQHALSALKRAGLPTEMNTRSLLRQVLEGSVTTKEWMTRGIYESRAKDYNNPFRSMVYDNKEQMEQVLGKLEDNTFIRQEEAGLLAFKEKVRSVLEKLGV